MLELRIPLKEIRRGLTQIKGGCPHARFHLAKPPTCEKKFPDEKRRGWCVTTEK